jgi:hypothetical protein
MLFSSTQKHFFVWWSFQKRHSPNTCWTLGGTMSLRAKLLKSQVGFVSWRPSKALPESQSIPHTPLSLNIRSCKTQDWVLEATKTYEVASTAEYKPYPPNLMGKKAILHWMSQKNGPPPTTISLNAARNSLSNKTTALSCEFVDTFGDRKKSLVILIHNQSRRSSL